MDPLCFDCNKEGIEVKSNEEFFTSDFTDVDDKFGDPEVLPRVGDQYQAEIPSLISVPSFSQFIEKESFSLGSRLPLMQKLRRVQSSCENLGYVSTKEGKVISESEYAKIEVKSKAFLLGQGFSNIQSSLKLDATVSESCPELKTELDQPKGVNQHWTSIEFNSFLLSLYAFGKNLNLLKRFVGSKNMGDILCFYYGKFYRSDGYCRWSKRRKLRVRRRIWGEKIFTGWRQQELLSRLFLHVSGECQTILVEISRNFAEGKMPFEDYIFAIKDAVGINLFIAAVGIGKGKQDLTGTAVEPTKINHFSVRSEMPIGKACSSLTSADIIKFLTGDFRLSKARSSHLFWEAVWPRLLAKGWHSEQPVDQAVSGSKQSLLFVIPGIKKFSRRRLVKGNHYFDSISDVLNKVASEPRLLEMETQTTEDNSDKEIKQDKQDLDDNDLSNKQQFCYPQPLASESQDQTEFTIVDTGKVNDFDQCKVRQMRSSAFQTVDIPSVLNLSSGSEQDMSQETEYQSNKASSSNPVEEFSKKLLNIELLDCTLTDEAINTTKEEDPLRENNECQIIQNMTFDSANCSPSIMEKQKLTPCNHLDLNHCAESDRNFDLNECPSPSYQLEACGGSLEIRNEGNATENQLVGGSAEKHESRILFDLNLPPFSPELEIEMEVPSSSMVILQNNDNQCEITCSSPSKINQCNDETQEFPNGYEEQQHIILNRRQSTKSRPLATKALEALEYRFVNSDRKRKNSEPSHYNSKSQHLHPSFGTILSANCENRLGNDMADTRAEKQNVIRTYNIDLNHCADHWDL